MTERIRSIHRASRGTYGAPGIRAKLAAEGTATSRKRVARLMRQSGLSGVRRPHPSGAYDDRQSAGAGRA
ncbi:MAG: IS3 family transposase [Bacillota bacterium]